MPSSATSDAATSSWVESGFEAQASTVAPPAFKRLAGGSRSRSSRAGRPRRRGPSRGRSRSKRSRIDRRTGISRVRPGDALSRPRPARLGSAMSPFARPAGSSDAPRGTPTASPLAEAALDLDEHGNGPGVDPLAAARCNETKSPIMIEVEELRELARPVGPDLDRPRPRPRRRARRRGRSDARPAGCSKSLRSVTIVITCRVTSPFWPNPQISLWHHSGWAAKNAGALAFSFTWVFHRRAATAPMPVGALDERDRPTEPLGDLERQAAAVERGCRGASPAARRAASIAGRHAMQEAEALAGRRAGARSWRQRRLAAGESLARS